MITPRMLDGHLPFPPDVILSDVYMFAQQLAAAATTAGPGGPPTFGDPPRRRSGVAPTPPGRQRRCPACRYVRARCKCPPDATGPQSRSAGRGQPANRTGSEVR